MKASAQRAARGRARTARLALVVAWGLVAVGCLGALVLSASRAGAHQDPAGCTQNNLALDIGRDKTVVRNGDTIVYTISASNLDSAQGAACHLTGTTFVFVAPAADGTPSGAQTVLRSNVDFPAGTTRTVLGTVPYAVAVNPGVTNTVAEAGATGVLHDAPVDDHANVLKTLGSTVTQPHTTLSASVTLTGTAPSAVAEFTYVERNDSSTLAPLVSITVVDDGCSPVTYASGDANDNHALDVGEAWAFGCKRTLTAPGRFTHHVLAQGVNMVDARPAPQEAASVSVTVAAAKAKAIPVTGPEVPLGPLAALAVVLIGTGVLALRRARSVNPSRRTGQ